MDELNARWDTQGVELRAVRLIAERPRPQLPYHKVEAVDAQGAVRFVAVGDDGRILTDAELSAQNDAARRARELEFGVLEPISDHIVASDPAIFEDGPISFVIYPRFTAPLRPFVDPDASEDAWTEADDLFRQYYDRLVASRLEAADDLERDLISLGFAVHGRLGRGILVRVNEVGLDALIRHPEAASVRLADERFLPSPYAGAASGNTYSGFDTFRLASPIAFDGNGFDTGGTGDKIGIGLTEWQSRFRVAPGNMGIIWKDPVNACATSMDCVQAGLGAVCQAGQCRDEHGSRVASVLGSLDGTSSVGARGARMYYCANIDNDFAACSAWWRTQGVHIASNSLGGTPTISALMRDEAVRYDNIAVTNYATNDGNSTPHSTCTSPNVICVGNFNHNSAGPNKMAASSSWQNWSGMDREQPDIAAPGTSVRVFGAATGVFVAGTGTSYATPAVASGIALLHDMSQTVGGPRYYPWLENYPEVSKALVMAAATEDVDNQGDVSDPGAPDERDGAGGLMMDALDEIYRAGRWSIILYTPASASPYAWRTVHLNAGDRLRAFIAWSRCPSNTVTDLHADLDIRLKDPSNTVLATNSFSYDQTYEGFEYTATQTGTHTIELYRWSMASCNGSTGEHVGLAYHVEN